MSYSRERELKFFVNDKEHTVYSGEIEPDTNLNDYLRRILNLTGTKAMCFEGGCGACIVVASIKDPVTSGTITISLNSCLIPVYKCSGWRIYTIEGIGDSTSGYHPLQKALVQFNGTQCGFCSSGMLMNMFALYESGEFTMEDVDNSFGGNICRCTGYRPILSAFKSLASDASSTHLGSYVDIEDIPTCRSRGKCALKCAEQCKSDDRPLYYQYNNSQWYKVFFIQQILNILKKYPESNYMLVGGNTAKGVYRNKTKIDLYIDITSVKALVGHQISKTNLILGASMTLSGAMNLFKKLSKENPKFAYLKKLADHIDLVGSVPIRNVGTLAGNLFTKHEHHEFSSDIFVFLETVGAHLTLVDINGKEHTMSLLDFLSFDMKRVLIKNIILPMLNDTYKMESYKITPRAQNASALINAGFLVRLNPDNVVELASLVYGAVNPTFVHATNSEKYLTGKQLFDDKTLQGLFETLNSEINPDFVLPQASPEFRKQLAIALCYKFILSITPEDKLSIRNKSGGEKFIRPVSTGTQDYETNESLYPLTQAIPKIEALAQCTGKAKYIMDMPDSPDQLYVAFVLAKATPYSVIKNIDPSEALKLEGVVAFYDKGDIPGENNFTPKEEIQFSTVEEIFCSGVVKYYYQPLGIVVAKNQKTALKAAELVQVDYEAGTEIPAFTIREILAIKGEEGLHFEFEHKATSKGENVKKVIEGKFDIFSQYHFSMETQCCIVIPEEDGLTLYPATQGISLVQSAVSKSLNIPLNKLNISVRRLGGGYGAKLTRANLIACAAALAAHKLQKPVKLWMPFTANMNAIGKRGPFSMDYKVEVDEKGSIQSLDASLYTDMGSFGGNENLTIEVMKFFLNNYENDTWNVKSYTGKSNIPTTTWCRAPATTEGSASILSIMNHIAADLNIDPVQVYMENFDKQQPSLSKYINDLIEWAEIDERKKEIKEFNAANRWVKKAIGIVPLGYPQLLFGNWNVQISIYQVDGTVAITHAGVEMGQGINTKVAQVCAYSLGIPLEFVSIKPSNVATSPNAFMTGGSLTSEAVCYATIKACDILKERMKPFKEKAGNLGWLLLVRLCYYANVELTAIAQFDPSNIGQYVTYGATSAEVQVDILTGTYSLLRVDLIEDTGNSMSPYVDIGQVEGAFIMGVGYWTSEKIVFGPEGELLTNRTWNYKPPGAKDIPIDFRVNFPKNNPNPQGVFNSKATAEPPLNMSCVVAFAIRNAVASARLESDNTATRWYPFDGPSTVENTFVNSLNNYKQYLL
ncbi:hypothetical protein FQA39_LY00263 [Lamprigera yunnana]|nr:hypothetical protein FQA39_LY00263 [Lamprigera yunnana]